MRGMFAHDSAIETTRKFDRTDNASVPSHRPARNNRTDGQDRLVQNKYAGTPARMMIRPGQVVAV